MVGTLNDMWQDMKNGVYDFTDNGKCIGCGRCCTSLLPLSSKDIKAIRRYIEKKHIKEQKAFYPLKEEPDFDLSCPFRSESEKKCLIYKFRPAICKAFRCDLPSKNIQRNKDVLHGKFNVYDMRELFYAENNNTDSTSHKEK